MIVASLMLAAAAVSIASGAAGHQLRLTVKPQVGGPMTHFTVSFSPPRAARYVAVATSACGQRVKSRPKAGRRGTRVHLTLPPTGTRWCTGTVHAQVRYVRTHQRVARFSFLVVTPATDVTPPNFAGLKSAVQCFPGPQTPGEQRPVSLSWNAATDDVTPASSITYDIYMGTASGGENFSSPSWTTQGVTSFATPDLPAGRFFVVRARDRAGNADHNTAERQAENPCL